jgi:hypothetical protein
MSRDATPGLSRSRAPAASTALWQVAATHDFAKTSVVRDSMVGSHVATDALPPLDDPPLAAPLSDDASFDEL